MFYKIIILLLFFSNIYSFNLELKTGFGIAFPIGTFSKSNFPKIFYDYSKFSNYDADYTSGFAKLGLGLDIGANIIHKNIIIITGLSIVEFGFQKQEMQLEYKKRINFDVDIISSSNYKCFTPKIGFGYKILSFSNIVNIYLNGIVYYNYLLNPKYDVLIDNTILLHRNEDIYKYNLSFSTNILTIYSLNNIISAYLEVGYISNKVDQSENIHKPIKYIPIYLGLTYDI